MHLSHVYGLDSHKPINFTNDSYLYVSGNLVVVSSFEDKTQHFLTSHGLDSTISSFCLSPNKRYVAVAEHNPERSVISIWDLLAVKRKKVLSFPEFSNTTIVSMAFSIDCRVLIVVTGAPHFQVCYSTWAKTKLSASLKNISTSSTTINHVSISPAHADGSLFLVCGTGVFRILRYAPGELSLRVAHGGLSSLKKENQNFSCAEWVSNDVIVVGSTTGDLHLITNGHYTTSFLDAPLDGHPIVKVSPFAKGFIAVSQEKGLYVYEFARQEDQEDENVKSLPSLTRMIYENKRIFQFCLNPSEDCFGILGASQELAFYSFLTDDVIDDDRLTVRDNQSRVADVIVRLISNYFDNFKCFDLHPSGFYVAVGLSDRLVISLVLDSSTLETCVLLNYSNISNISWSKCGSFLSFACGQSIYIYSFSASAVYACPVPSSAIPPPSFYQCLKKHTSPVSGLEFSSSGDLYSTSDGTVVLWSQVDGKWANSKAWYETGFEIESLTVSVDEMSCFIGCSDGKIRQLTKNFDLLIELDIGIHCSSLHCVSKNILSVGSSEGVVKTIRLPLTSDCTAESSVRVHTQSVLKIFSKTRGSDCFVYSVGLDKVVSLFESVLPTIGVSPADEFMTGIEITDGHLLIENRRVVDEKRSEIEFLQQRHVFELLLRNEGFNLKIREKSDDMKKS
ncbi:hypothetical protein GEMRC1_007859 [Eukaryota sp. GEM-RC1]